MLDNKPQVCYYTIVMKYTQTTYIDLRPEIAEPDEPLSPLAFHVRRDARIVLKYEVRKYIVFVGKTAVSGLKRAVLGIVDVVERDMAYEQARKARIAELRQLVK